MKPIYWKNIPPELACLTRWVVWKGERGELYSQSQPGASGLLKQQQKRASIPGLLALSLVLPL